jgi:hypothetical protein
MVQKVLQNMLDRGFLHKGINEIQVSSCVAILARMAHMVFDLFCLVQSVCILPCGIKSPQ